MSAELTRSILPAPAEYGGKSPYHLSPEQIQFFDDNGYLLLHGLITGPLLERLQAAGHDWIAQGMELPDSPDNLSMDADFQFAQREVGKVMYRISYLHNKGHDASLELLGHPAILGVAESLCGKNFVPTYETMVFKNKGDGEKIKWHQDAIHPHRKWRIFNLDLYLDPSLSDSGALRVVPKTQFHEVEVCSTVGADQWEGPQIETIEMQPGDVLLHDVMILHGSPRTVSKAMRRTIYYEFRAAEEILEDGPWDKAWIDKRMRLMPIALKKYAQAQPNQPEFQWNVDSQFKPAPAADDEVELKVAHEVHMRYTYCSAGDVTPRTSS